MSTLFIGLMVVAVSAASVIPALFSSRPEPATTEGRPRRQATGDDIRVSPTRRLGAALGLLGMVTGSAMAVAAILGVAVLLLGRLVN